MTSTDTVDDGGQTAVVEQKTDDYVLASEQEAGENAGGEQEQARENAEKDPNTEQAEQKPKKMGGYQRRIHNLSNENALLRQQLMEFQQQQQAAGGKRPEQNAAVAKAQDGEPDIDDFENVLDYLKAHNQWSSEQALKAFKTEQETTAKEQQAHAEYEAKQESFNERVDALIETVPDFYERASALYQQGLVTPAMESAILDSPVGEMVSLYFMANPHELEALAQATEAQVYRAVALIEAHLLQGQGRQQQQVQQGTVKRTTTAAAPITPVKPSANTQASIRDDVPYEDWVKLREKSLRG